VRSVRLYRVVPTIAHFGFITLRIPLFYSRLVLIIAIKASCNLLACRLPSNQSSATPGSGCVLVTVTNVPFSFTQRFLRDLPALALNRTLN